jgi:hypothetical protein
MKNFSSKIIFLLLLLPSWVYAADGDESNRFVELTNQELEEFARDICVSWQESGKGICESESSFITSLGQDWSLSSKAIYGSFSQQNTKEILLLLTTDSHGSYWNALLLRDVNGKWIVVSEILKFDFDEFGLTPEYECFTVATNQNYDRLLCRLDNLLLPSPEGWMVTFPELGEPTGLLHLWFADLSNSVVSKKQFLLTLANPFLDLQTRTKLGNVLPSVYAPTNWYQVDMDGNGYSDVVLELSTAQSERVWHDSRENITFYLLEEPYAEFHKLIWLFDGETFTPTPETQTFLNNLPKQ